MSTPSLTDPTDFLNALPKLQTEEQYRALFDAMNEEMIRIEARMTAREALHAASRARISSADKIITDNIAWLRASLNVG